MYFVELCCQDESCKSRKTLYQFIKAKLKYYGCQHPACFGDQVLNSCIKQLDDNAYYAILKLACSYHVVVPTGRRDFNNAARHVIKQPYVPNFIKRNLYNIIELRNFVTHYHDIKQHCANPDNMCIGWFNEIFTECMDSFKVVEPSPQISMPFGYIPMPPGLQVPYMPVSVSDEREMKMLRETRNQIKNERQYLAYLQYALAEQYRSIDEYKYRLYDYQQAVEEYYRAIDEYKYELVAFYMQQIAAIEAMSKYRSSRPAN